MRKLVVLLPLLISGCATIFDGKEQNIILNSSPEGASMVIPPFLTGLRSRG